MRRWLTSLPALACMMLAGVIPALAEAGGYRITGVVVSSVTGQPVLRCHLMPTPEREVDGAAPAVVSGPTVGRSRPGPGRFGNRNNLPVMTESAASFDCDQRGHFSIDLPHGGRWSLVATARGYRTSAYDQHENFSSAIVLGEAAPAIDLRFRLDPESSVYGYIHDEADEPISNANVQLLRGDRNGVSGAMRFTTNSSVQTDDRGRYEFPSLSPGSYQVLVQAQPWYVVGGQQFGGGDRDGPLNPALDVVYPLTWYPGVTDSANAGTFALRAGEEREADLRLLPIPSVHLRIAAPAPGEVGDPPYSNGRQPPRFPQIAQLTPNGGMMYGQTSVWSSANGDLNVSGLAPGTYQVTLQTPGRQAGAGDVSILHVASGSARTLDLAAAIAEVPVTIETDGPEGSRPNITLIDLDTGRTTFVANGMPRRRGPPGEDATEKDVRTAQVPPGRYQVVLQGSGDLFIKGITAEGAQANGRVVTIRGGSPKLLLHLGSGRGSVSGFVTVAGKPTSGAMVLLIPTTMGDPAGLPIARRDQSDTDGSFHITAVLPGQYILLAIDHGWEVNWNDPVTLNRYLVSGVPLDLTTAGARKQDIEAQDP